MRAKELPDILVISVDTMRRDCMAPYGADLMPAVTSLLHEGVAFDKCFSTAPWTGASFGSMFTGLWPRQHGCLAEIRPGLPVKRRPLKPDVQFLPKMLKKAGYYTISSQANNWVLGPGGGFERGFDDYCVWEGYKQLVKRVGVLRAEKKSLSLAGTKKYLAYCYTRGMAVLTKRLSSYSVMRCGEVIVHAALRQLQKAPSDKPVFLWINFVDMHAPYGAPRQWMDPAEAPGGVVRPVHIAPLTHRDEELSEADKLYIHRRYDNTGRYVNACISDLLAGWSAIRRKRSRLTFFHSDHGDEFWEHHNGNRGDLAEDVAAVGHGMSLSNELIHVPFVIHWPEAGVNGVRVNNIVSLIDFTPTIVDLLGLDEDTSFMAGQSLAAYVTSTSPPEEEQRIVFTDSLYLVKEHQAAISSTHKLIRCVETGKSQLFAWDEDDPGEKRDLASSPQHKAILERLTAALDEWDASLADIKHTHSYPPDQQEAIEARLRELGYI
ncbi:MAG: sulfatase [Desulfobacteraceae bacterium]|nr:sulfatase [Desulfobacteraceae bacterium]